MKKALLLILTGTFAFYYSIAGDTDPFLKKYAPTPIMVIKDTLQKKTRIPWKFELENTFTNTYFWRGIVFNSGIICQPDFSVKKGNWTVTTWTNFVLKAGANNVITPETDMFISYENRYKNFSFAPGVNVYFYPSNSQNIFTSELTGVFKYYAQPVGFYFSPAYDCISNLGGYYMDYGFFRNDSISPRFSLESKLLMGYGNKQFNEYYNYESGRFLVGNESEQFFMQDYKTARLEFQANCKVTSKVTVKPQLIMFSTFSDGNNYSQVPVRFIGAATLTYDF